MNIDLYKGVPIVISSFAFFISYLSYRKVKRIDDNSLIRLIVASETLESDFKNLHAIYGRAHLFGKLNEELSDELSAGFNKVESKVELLYDLLLQNKKIDKKDLRKIIKTLEEVESKLMDLKYFEIESLDDINATRAFINPIYRNVELVKSNLSEYDKYS